MLILKKKIQTVQNDIELEGKAPFPSLPMPTS